jgi:hypothetical protein
MQRNGLVESSNRRLWDEYLNEHLCSSLAAVCRIIEAWGSTTTPSAQMQASRDLRQHPFATHPGQGQTENELSL